MISTSVDFPTFSVGAKSISYWATIGMILIEGVMLLLCVGSYFYLRTTVPEFPAPPFHPPGLVLPTLMLFGLLLTVPIVLSIDRAAHELDARRAISGLMVLCVWGCLLVVLRWYEFRSLNVSWDTNAYGSMIWTLIGLHAFHLISEVIETIGLTAFLLAGYTRGAYMSDTSDSCVFWYFIVGGWLLLYPIIYLLPQWR